MSLPQKLSPNLKRESFSNAASQDLDFFVALGDTAYADFASPAVPSQQGGAPQSGNLVQGFADAFGDW